MEERQLDEVAPRPGEDRVDDGDADEPIAVKHPDKLRTAVERGLEPRE